MVFPSFLSNLFHYILTGIVKLLTDSPAVIVLLHTDLTGSKSDQASVLQCEKLKKEDEDLKEKFEKVIEMVQESFIKKEVKVKKVLSSLNFLKGHEGRQKVNHHFQDLHQDQSLEKLFFIFCDIWDYIHPGLLEFIVKRFGTTSDKNVVQKYKEDLEKYRRSVKLGDFVKVCKKLNPLLYHKKMSVIVGDDWRDKTLQHLEDVRLQVADKIECDKMLLQSYPKQSQFTIVFRMPSWVQLNLVDLYPVLSTIGVTKVYLNDDYIYDCVPLKVRTIFVLNITNDIIQKHTLFFVFRKKQTKNYLVMNLPSAAKLNKCSLFKVMLARCC